MRKGEQKLNNGDLGLLESSFPISLGILEGWGIFRGEEWLHPSPF